MRLRATEFKAARLPTAPRKDLDSAACEPEKEGRKESYRHETTDHGGYPDFLALASACGPITPGSMTLEDCRLQSISRCSQPLKKSIILGPQPPLSLPEWRYRGSQCEMHWDHLMAGFNKLCALGPRRRGAHEIESILQTKPPRPGVSDRRAASTGLGQTEESIS
jgi:hypothetical protein